MTASTLSEYTRLVYMSKNFAVALTRSSWVSSGARFDSTSMDGAGEMAMVGLLGRAVVTSQ